MRNPMFGMTDTTTLVTGILALILTVLAFIFVLPEGNRKKGAFLNALHHLFSLNYLLIERLLQFVYLMGTFMSILYGISVLFHGGEDGAYGLLIILGAPIVIRIGYELLSMMISLTRNTMDINKKLSREYRPGEAEPFQRRDPSNYGNSPAATTTEESSPKSAFALDRNFR